MTVQTTKIHPGGDNRLEETGPPPRTLRVGTVLWERYEVVAVLGASELGEIWCCLDRETGAEVSLRLLPQDLRRSKPTLAMIHDVIRRLADKTHANLAAIRQLVYMGDQIYVVGDFAPGMDVGAWSRAGPAGRRPPEEVLPVVRQAAAGLDFAHGCRIVHRNLKPSNIYLGPDGVVRVTDFGLTPRQHLTIFHREAKRTGSTGPYLAPELKAGEEADAASDQYALAVLAWELLAGAIPNPEQDEPPADLPVAARLALRRALSRKPRNRFASCADFVRALGGERVTRRRGRSAAEWKRIRFCAALVAAIPLVGAALAGVGYLAIQALNRPPPAAPEKKPEVVRPAPEKKPARPAAVERLVATTPLPVEGRPWVTQTAGMEFVWVPALRMWVGRFEVTNEEYLEKDPAHESGDFRGLCLQGKRQPVVRVNFDDTVAFAAWLTEQERAAGKLPAGWRYRLPARAEAIAYTRAGLGAVYPWGEAWPPMRGNYGDEALGAAFTDLQCISGYQDGFAVTAPVESGGENSWGLFGAGGNVWETTSKAAGSADFGGWHGGGWDDHLPARLGCEATYGFIGNARGAVNGFRLVLARIADEAPPPPAAKAAPSAAGTPVPPG